MTRRDEGARRTRRPRWLPVAAVVLATALSACGVPRSSQPAAIDPSSVPFGLLDPSAGTDQAPPGTQPATLYLVKGAHLVPARRVLPAPVRADTLVRSVLQPLDTAETAAGLRSAVPAPTRLLSLDLIGTTATIDLSADFAQVSGDEQVLAVAELVLAATASDEVTAVQFQLEGRAVDVPSADGSLSEGPVTRAEYQSLVA